MAIWNGLFFKAREFRADPEKSAEWNRGAYLVQGLGHCGDCHSPKNIFGAEKTSEAYQGGNLQGWFAPTVTSDGRIGLGAWTVDDVAEYLHTGHNKNAAASGPMAEVVALSTSRMSLPDLRAIAVWLKDLPGANGEPAPAPAKTVMDAGHRVFQAQCGACHGSSGLGVPNLFPGLAGAPDVQSDDFTNLLRVVLQGGKSVATSTKPTGPAMPAFGWKLSNEQIADVTTYIRNDWGNVAQAVSASDVATERRKLRRTP
jgi:mono/diheme cytochrome c family protein